MRLLSGLAVAAAALLASSAARASIIFQTDFEAPLYSTGGLAGQDGWAVFNNPAAVTVDDTAPIDGLQSAKVTGALAPGQTGPYHSDASAASMVTLSADILLTGGAAQRGWQFSAIGAGLIGFTGGIDIAPNGDILAISGAFPVIGNFSRDSVHRVDILLDYTAQSFGVRLDGATLASGLSFCNSNGACGGPAPGVQYDSLIFDTFGAAGDDAGYLDNILVQSVPEPAAWALMIMGFGLAGATLRRRRLAHA